MVGSITSRNRGTHTVKTNQTSPNGQPDNGAKRHLILDELVRPGSDDGNQTTKQGRKTIPSSNLRQLGSLLINGHEISLKKDRHALATIDGALSGFVIEPVDLAAFRALLGARKPSGTDEENTQPNQPTDPEHHGEGVQKLPK